MSGSPDDIRVSVVVPTHDRPHSLGRLVAALELGGWPPSRTELVVVADGCSDETLSAMDALHASFPMRTLELVPGRGAAVARNRGAGAALGELLVFMDDDIEPLPGMIAAHVRAHEQPGQVVIGPPLPVRHAGADFNQLSQWAWWHDRFAAFRAPHHRFNFADVFTGILSIRAAHFRAIGGFDESLACREDHEFGVRLLAAGADLRFVDDGGGWHHELRNTRNLATRKRAEGAADVQIARRHPALFTQLHLSDPSSRGTRTWRLLRRMALSSSGSVLARGGAGAAMAKTLGAARWLFERLRLRLSWRRANGALLEYWYWRGVGEAAGGEAGLRALETACLRTDAGDHTELRVDLAMDLHRVLHATDAARAEGVRLTWKGADVARIPPCPGAERMRGEHVRHALGTWLAREFSTVRQLDQLARWSPQVRRQWRRPVITLSHTAHEARRTVDLCRRMLTRAAPGGAPLATRLAATDTRLANGAGMRVAEVELACGPPRIAFHDTLTHGRVRALLRTGGRPVDWLTLDDNGDPVDADVITRGVLRRRATGLTNMPAMAPCDGDPSRPPISVIVCTRDRPAALEECLRTLCEVDYPAYEVVVIDNASRSEEPRRVAGRYGVRCVREDRPGLDNARNRGILEAAHDLVAFTDDDAQVDRGWLHAIADAFMDEGVHAVTGYVAPAALDTRARQLFEFAYGGMGKGPIAHTWEGATLDNASRIMTQHVGVGVNMAFRRHVLLAEDGFDPALDVGTPSHGAGDLDMFHRLLESGYTIRYEPRALVWHRHRDSMDGLRRQLFDNGRAFGVYLLRRLRDGRVSRWSTTRMFLQWMRWHARRVVARYRRQEPLPLPFIAAEIAGAFTSPVAYVRTYHANTGAPRLSLPGDAR